MKRPVFSLLFILCYTCSQAQKVDIPTAEVDWCIQSVSSDISNALSDVPAFAKGILYISASEMIAPVKLGKKEYGVIKINSSGKLLWQVSISDPILGIGKLNGKIIVFFKEEKANATQVMGAVLDATTGKKLVEKTAFENTEETRAEVKILNTPSGEFSHMLIRATADKGKFSPYTADMGGRSLKTLKCYAITYDESLNPTKTQQMAVPPESNFIGCVANKEKEIFAVYAEDDKMVAAKFTKDGASVTKLMAPFNQKKDRFIYPEISADESFPQRILLAVSFPNGSKDMVHTLYNFDFDAKKVLTTGEEPLDKDYMKTIEMEEIKEAKDIKFRYIAALQPVGILPSADKIIVIKEKRIISTSNSGSSMYSTEHLFVSFYSKDLKPIKTIGLNKYFESFMDVGRSISWHVYGDKLYITTSAISGVASYVSLLCTVDMPSMKFEKITALDKGDLSRDKTIEPGATLWFPKTVFVNYLIPKGGLIVKDVNTVMQKITIQ
jgi:hypothetical protein